MEEGNKGESAVNAALGHSIPNTSASDLCVRPAQRNQAEKDLEHVASLQVEFGEKRSRHLMRDERVQVSRSSVENVVRGGMMRKGQGSRVRLQNAHSRSLRREDIARTRG